MPIANVRGSALNSFRTVGNSIVRVKGINDSPFLFSDLALAHRRYLGMYLTTLSLVAERLCREVEILSLPFLRVDAKEQYRTPSQLPPKLQIEADLFYACKKAGTSRYG